MPVLEPCVPLWISLKNQVGVPRVPRGLPVRVGVGQSLTVELETGGNGRHVWGTGSTLRAYCLQLYIICTMYHIYMWYCE